DCFWLLYKVPQSKQPERFMLGFGGQRSNRLAQSQLGAGARTEEGYDVLKQVARDLEQRTTAGIWVIGETGHIAYCKKDRISEGAKKASRSGQLDLVSIAF